MKDIMRCLKRAIAREIYQELTRPTGFTTTIAPIRYGTDCRLTDYRSIPWCSAERAARTVAVIR